MKLMVIYRPNSEHESQVISFVRDFQRRYEEAGQKIQMVSLDTRDGVSMATLYGVMAYPAIVAADDKGSALSVWQGLPFPLMDEVAGYART